MLCAGLGTRLRPLTALVPKPLVPVGDRPLVEHAVSLLHAAGARDFSFNAFYLPEQVQRFVSALPLAGATLESVVERELLGTGGGLRGLYRGHDHVVVWNGDIYAPDLDVDAVLAFGRQECPVLVVAPTVGHAGTVGLDGSGRVVSLRGETFGTSLCAADYIGVGVFPRAFIETLPRRGCLVGDGLVPWLAQGKPVATIMHPGHWSDGGTVEQYLAQNQHWLANHAPHDGAERAVAQLRSYLGAHARCAPEVTLTDSVVGRGARIVGEGELVRCVVWPGAVASAPLAGAVVLPDGAIAVASPLPARIGGRG
jgi:mannose-1-phosphate guanylyltransferase